MSKPSAFQSIRVSNAVYERLAAVAKITRHSIAKVADISLEDVLNAIEQKKTLKPRLGVVYHSMKQADTEAI